MNSWLEMTNLVESLKIDENKGLGLSRLLALLAPKAKTKRLAK